MQHKLKFGFLWPFSFIHIQRRSNNNRRVHYASLILLNQFLCWAQTERNLMISKCSFVSWSALVMCITKKKVTFMKRLALYAMFWMVLIARSAICTLILECVFASCCFFLFYRITLPSPHCKLTQSAVIFTPLDVH